MVKKREPATVPLQAFDGAALSFADGSAPVPTWASLDTSREPWALYFVDATSRPVGVRSVTFAPGDEKDRTLGQVRRLAEARAELALGGDHLTAARDPKFKADRDALAEQYLKGE